jgi:hypothetical protein
LVVGRCEGSRRRWVATDPEVCAKRRADCERRLAANLRQQLEAGSKLVSESVWRSLHGKSSCFDASASGLHSLCGHSQNWRPLKLKQPPRPAPERADVAGGSARRSLGGAGAARSVLRSAGRTHSPSRLRTPFAGQVSATQWPSFSRSRVPQVVAQTRSRRALRSSSNSVAGASGTLALCVRVAKFSMALRSVGVCQFESIGAKYQPSR